MCLYSVKEPKAEKKVHLCYIIALNSISILLLIGAIGRYVLFLLLYHFIESGDIGKYDDFLDCKNVKELVGGYVESEKTCQKNADRDEIISLYKEGSISGKEARNRLTVLYGDDDEAIEDAIERMYQGDHYYDDDEEEDCDDDEADYEASIYDLADKIPDEDLREKILYKLEQMGL